MLIFLLVLAVQKSTNINVSSTVAGTVIDQAILCDRTGLYTLSDIRDLLIVGDMIDLRRIGNDTA
jgi:hypothetical protein